MRNRISGHCCFFLQSTDTGIRISALVSEKHRSRHEAAKSTSIDASRQSKRASERLLSNGSRTSFVVVGRSFDFVQDDVTITRSTFLSPLPGKVPESFE